jgi:AcrR family transcriptional regulator
MPRPAKHSVQGILDAAADIVARDGPGAATVTAIGRAIRAPNGSIYHRFQTRDELLGRLWLRTAAQYQDAFAAAAKLPDPVEAALAAALSLPRTARADLTGARIMLLHRREDFLSGSWPPDLMHEATRLAEQATGVIGTMTRRLFGRNTDANRLTTVFAMLDLPFAAVRRHVSKGEAPPPHVDGLIETAYRAVIAARTTAAE